MDLHLLFVLLFILLFLFIGIPASAGVLLTKRYKAEIESNPAVQHVFNNVRYHTSRLIPISLLLLICSAAYFFTSFILYLADSSSPALTNYFYSLFALIAILLFTLGNYMLLYAYPFNATKRFLQNKTSSFSLLALEYSPGGRLQYWGEATRAYNKSIGWLEMVYPEILKKLAAIKAAPLRIISPAANNAAYERWIAYQLACDLTAPIQFICSDQALIEEDCTQTIDHPLLDYTYCPNTKAEDLKQTLLEKGIETVHCIIDFKGIIWHHADECQEIDTILHDFNEWLQPGGCMIIDAALSSRWSLFINDLTLRLMGKIYGYAETSTYESIRKYIASSVTLQNYTVELVGEGAYRMALLHKQA